MALTAQARQASPSSSRIITLAQRNQALEEAITWHCKRPETACLMLVGALILIHLPKQETPMPVERLLAEILTDLILETPNTADFFNTTPALKKWFSTINSADSKDEKEPNLSRNNKTFTKGMLEAIEHNLRAFSDNKDEVLAIIERWYVNLNNTHVRETQKAANEVDRFLHDLKTLHRKIALALEVRREKIMVKYKKFDFYTFGVSIHETCPTFSAKLKKVFQQHEKRLEIKRKRNELILIPVLAFLIFLDNIAAGKAVKFFRSESSEDSYQMTRLVSAILTLALLAFITKKIGSKCLEAQDRRAADEYKEEHTRHLPHSFNIEIYWRPLKENEKNRTEGINGKMLDFDLDLRSAKPITQHPQT